MPHSKSSTLVRAALRFSTVILAIIIVLTIQNVDGKGGFGRGGVFRSSSRGSGYRGGFGSSGRGYYGGVGLRSRWWMMGAVACKQRRLIYNLEF